VTTRCERPKRAFDDLPGYPWQPRYVSDLPALGGLRLHYLDEGRKSRSRRGRPDLPVPARQPGLELPLPQDDPGAAGSRAQGRCAPDLVGFGKSDKPKKDSFHTFSVHRQILLELVERLDLKNVVLVVQDWGGLLGLTLPMAAPQRYGGLLVMNTTLGTGDVPLPAGFVAWREMCAKNPEFDVARLFARGNPQMSAAECAAYNAPFPDKGHRAALRAFPPMVPDAPDADGAAASREARSFWQNDWTGRTLMVVGAQDPVLGPPVMHELQALIRGCGEPVVLEQAGHFVQEHGEPVARQAVRFFSPAV
jgi:tRNA(adenine34) deaminase